MNKLFVFTIYFLSFVLDVTAGGKKGNDAKAKKLDIVFCLDLSGSTNGLITDVRESLWHIVNQVNLLDPVPDFRIGLVGFSRPSFKLENAYVKVLCDLTSDFNQLSHEFYKLRPSVEQGDQYVGAAINICVTKLNWTEDKGATKIIYIVGNGTVGTNNNEYIKSCQLAVEHNIIVNAIYVMGKGNKAREMIGWYRIANLTNGFASEIAIGKKSPKYSKQVDFAALTQASRELNKTYIYHGILGYLKYIYNVEADSMSLNGSPTVFIERAYYKNTNLYKWSNSKWDMVDYLKSTGMLPAMDDTLNIPDSLRNIPTEEIYNLVQDQKIKRQVIIKKIENIFKENYPLQIHKQYVSGELKEENSFSGNVLIMLLKEWK